MKYLKAESFKWKRTFANQLLWIAPLMTALFAWFVSGFYGFQYMTFYWWYAFLLPGTIAVLCYLSHQREERAGRYYSVFSLPVDLKRFEFAKASVIIGKLLVAAVFLAFLVSVGNVVSPGLAVYSVGRSLIGSIGIILASIWQIPLCLYLARKGGMLMPVMINTLFGIFLPIIFGKAAVVWMCPYCWAAKLAEPLMGIEINGTFSGKVSFSWSVFLALVLSLALYIVLACWDAKNFSCREVK